MRNSTIGVLKQRQMYVRDGRDVDILTGHKVLRQEFSARRKKRVFGDAELD